MISRRQFLATGAAIAGAAVLAPPAPSRVCFKPLLVGGLSIQWLSFVCSRTLGEHRDATAARVAGPIEVFRRRFESNRMDATEEHVALGP